MHVKYVLDLIQLSTVDERVVVSVSKQLDTNFGRRTDENRARPSAKKRESASKRV